MANENGAGNKTEESQTGKVLGKIEGKTAPRKLNRLQHLYYNAEALAQAAEMASQMAAMASGTYYAYLAEIKDEYGIPDAMLVTVSFLTGEIRADEKAIMRQVDQELKAKGEAGLPPGIIPMIGGTPG